MALPTGIFNPSGLPIAADGSTDSFRVLRREENGGGLQGLRGTLLALGDLGGGTLTLQIHPNPNASADDDTGWIATSITISAVNTAVILDETVPLRAPQYRWSLAGATAPSVTIYHMTPVQLGPLVEDPNALIGR